MHAELRFGDGMIMSGSKNDRPYGRLIKQPDEIGGYATQGLYVIVTDADAAAGLTGLRIEKATACELALF